MRNHSNLNPNLPIDRGVQAETLEYNGADTRDPDAYPLSVKLRHLSPEEANPNAGKDSNGATSGLVGSNLNGQSWESYASQNKPADGTLETVQAKYVLGCDGAHSWVRSQIGVKMEGSSKESVW